MAAVELSSNAAAWLEDADPTAHEQVTNRLEQAADFPEHFLTRLSNSPYYKLRAGDYRALVDWRRDDGVLFVREIGHRDGFYD